MSEAELKQVLATLESPIWRKYQGLGDDMMRALGEKLGPEVKDGVEPRLRALDQTMSKRLGLGDSAAASGAGKGK